MVVAQKTGPQKATPTVPFLNPEPIAYLVGWSNEAPIIVDRQKVITLIDLGHRPPAEALGLANE